MKDKTIIKCLALYGASLIFFTFYNQTNYASYPSDPPTDKIADSLLIEAIVYVESRGNDSAYNKESGAVGCMQIMPVMVREVNRICKLTQTDKSFTLEDRWDCDKSKEMFLLWKKFHHKTSTPERIARHWWGGPKYGEQECSLFYWEQVKLNLEI